MTALQQEATAKINAMSPSGVRAVLAFINEYIRQTDDTDPVAEAIANGEGPLRRKSKEDILSDLAQSRKDYEEGRYQSFDEAMEELGRKHGFI